MLSYLSPLLDLTLSTDLTKSERKYYHMAVSPLSGESARELAVKGVLEAMQLLGGAGLTIQR